MDQERPIILAREVLHASRHRRIDAQIKPDGRQPHELARTKSLRYSIGNLEGTFMLAEMGDRLRIDLWHYASRDGRGIQAAIDYLLPYADPARAWPHQQIEPLDRLRLSFLLCRAALAYQDPRYEQAFAKLPVAAVAVRRARLVHCTARR